jgi:hypothetical protein
MAQMNRRQLEIRLQQVELALGLDRTSRGGSAIEESILSGTFFLRRPAARL